MKKFLLAYRHLIVLTWLIIILFIFKVTINFKFENGLSLVFIFLLIIVPLIFYIYILVGIRKNRNQIVLNKNGYFQILLKDINTTNFNINFLDKLSFLNLKYLVNINEEVVVKIINHNNEILNIIFDQTKASIVILNTEIKYNFYYSHIIDEFTKYDLRNFEYKEPIVLYTKILEKVSELINKEYTYIYTNKKILLTSNSNKQNIYEYNMKSNIRIKQKKEQKIINL